MAASTVEITVQIKVNGRTLEGFPLTRRLSCQGFQDSITEHTDEAAQASLANDYKVPWNANSLTNPKFLFITADGEVRISPKTADAASLYPIVLNGTGFLLAVDLVTDETSNASFGVCNNGGDTVERAIVGGDTGA